MFSFSFVAMLIGNEYMQWYEHKIMFSQYIYSVLIIELI